MAWVRWSDKDGPHPYESRIYVMDHVDGDLECVNCLLLPAARYRDYSRVGMVEHIKEHIAAGDAVPDFVIPSLLGYGPKWEDTTLAEMIEGCRKNGARIVTDDAEVPAEFRWSFAELMAYAQEQGLSATEVMDAIGEA